MPKPDEKPNGAQRFEIVAEPLTAAAFAPFGDVIETPAGEGEDANSGTGRRWRDVTRIDAVEQSGEVDASIYRAFARDLPLTVDMLERHPLSSQLFLPLGGRPFLVIVAEGGGDRPAIGKVRAFLTNGAQGVNYARSVWHHPLIAILKDTEFLVVGRRGPGHNFDLVAFEDGASVHVITNGAETV